MDTTTACFPYRPEICSIAEDPLHTPPLWHGGEGKGRGRGHATGGSCGQWMCMVRRHRRTASNQHGTHSKRGCWSHLAITSSAAVTASLPIDTLSAPARKYLAATSTADHVLPEGQWGGSR